jgi:hypothetical protein
VQVHVPPPLIYKNNLKSQRHCICTLLGVVCFWRVSPCAVRGNGVWSGRPLLALRVGVRMPGAGYGQWHILRKYVAVAAAIGLESSQEPGGLGASNFFSPRAGICQKKPVTCLGLASVQEPIFGLWGRQVAEQASFLPPCRTASPSALRVFALVKLLLFRFPALLIEMFCCRPPGLWRFDMPTSLFGFPNRPNYSQRFAYL